MARFDPREALRPSLRDLPPYQALDDLEAVARSLGLDPAAVIKVDGNENPYGPSPKALEVLRAVGYQPHRYGDADQLALRGAIAGHLGVSSESIVAGAGSDELIDLLFRLFTSAGDAIVTASPTFGMYAFDAQLHAVTVRDVPLLDGWSFDHEGLVQAAMESKAVFIPSPNNPTGNTIPATLVDRLVETGSMVIIDEAYIEFSHAESLARRAASTPGLVVLRTLSKWGGLAGMRIGYGVMDPETAAICMQAKQPYNTNTAGELAAVASFEDAPILNDRACSIAGERDRMSAALAGLGWVHPYPSEASFVLMRLGRGDGRTVRDALRRRGVFTRYIDAPRLQDHIRVSVALPEQNDRIVEAFREVGEELAHG